MPAKGAVGAQSGGLRIFFFCVFDAKACSFDEWVALPAGMCYGSSSCRAADAPGSERMIR